METSVNLLTPGQIFAERYRIERYLARGGYGAVYVAEQLATELRVAIKVLWPQILASDDAVDKFKLEARVASRINSEYIVRVFDAGLDAPSNMPFLVMELLQGQDLERLVLANGPLPPERAIIYLSHVAAALDKAHAYVDRDGSARPIVHRDLKPENLFLTHREDGVPVVKVLDFGIAKVVGSTTDVSREMKGTPLFMAFEQIAGQTISSKTDVWALGLIAFYLMTGAHYWNATRLQETSLTALFGEVLSLPLASPSARLAQINRPPLPPAFDNWFFGCVNRDANQRFATAGQAIAALADIFRVRLTATGGAAAAIGGTAPGLGAPLATFPVAPAGAEAETQRSAEPYSGAIGTTPVTVGTHTEGAIIVSRQHGSRRNAAVSVAVVGMLAVVAGGVLAWRFLRSERDAAGSVTGEPVGAAAMRGVGPSVPSQAVPSPAIPPSAAPAVAAAAPSVERPSPSARVVTTPVAASAGAPRTLRPVTTKPEKSNVFDER